MLDKTSTFSIYHCGLHYLQVMCFAGFVCVNVDVALFPNEHQMGMGIVSWDLSDQLKLVCSQRIEGITSPFFFEVSPSGLY